jgi:hypothetical protein
VKAKFWTTPFTVAHQSPTAQTSLCAMVVMSRMIAFSAPGGLGLGTTSQVSQDWP